MDVTGIVPKEKKKNSEAMHQTKHTALQGKRAYKATINKNYISGSQGLRYK